MSKLSTLGLFTCLGLTSVFPIALSQEESPKNDESKSAAAEAMKGTPTIDGEIDEVWGKAKELPVNKLVTSESSASEKEMATATVKLLWDEDNLYALWEVEDDKLSGGGYESWEADSVELFVDELNEKTTSYGDDDVQYRVSFEGKLSGGTGYKEENVKASTKKTDTGYVVEMAVKLLHAKREAGTRIGLELQVNDNGGDNSRVAVAKWNHAENDSYMSTKDFGEIVLMAGE